MDKILIKNLLDQIDKNLNRVVEETKKEISSETLKGNYEFVEKHIKTLRKIDIIQASLKEVNAEYFNTLKHLDSDSPHIERLSKGKKIPQKEYYIPILKILVLLGGSADNKRVLKEVYRMMKDRFSEYDNKNLDNRTESRWENTARWARKNLVDMGYLSNSSSSGIWEITRSGREYLDDHQ